MPAIVLWRWMKCECRVAARTAAPSARLIIPAVLKKWGKNVIIVKPDSEQILPHVPILLMCIPKSVPLKINGFFRFIFKQERDGRAAVWARLFVSGDMS